MHNYGRINCIWREIRMSTSDSSAKNEPDVTNAKSTCNLFVTVKMKPSAGMQHSPFLTTYYCLHSSLLGTVHFPHLLAIFNLTGWNCLLCSLMCTAYFHRHVVLIVFRSSLYFLAHCMVMFTLLISRYYLLSSRLGIVHFPLYFWLLFLTTWVVYFITTCYYLLFSRVGTTHFPHYFLLIKTWIVFFTTWSCLLSSIFDTVYCSHF